MAHKVSLLSFLQAGSPGIQLGPHPDTTPQKPSHHPYSFRDVTSLREWEEFNIDTILNQHGPLLENIHLELDTLNPSSIYPPIANIIDFKDVFEFGVAAQVRQALHASFHQLDVDEEEVEEFSPDHSPEYTAVELGPGEKSWSHDDFHADTAYYEPHLIPGSGPNRAPGFFKFSSEWSTELRSKTEMNESEEPPGTDGSGENRVFLEAISQANYYMVQYGARYGFLLTDRELVALKRLDADGNVQLSDPISWDAHGSADQPRMTMLTALWYLGMLASNNHYWFL